MQRCRDFAGPKKIAQQGLAVLWYAAQHQSLEQRLVAKLPEQIGHSRARTSSACVASLLGAEVIQFKCAHGLVFREQVAYQSSQ